MYLCVKHKSGISGNLCIPSLRVQLTFKQAYLGFSEKAVAGSEAECGHQLAQSPQVSFAAE
jgi:hypothetical protein